jgi:hypothetical protein
VIESRVLRRMFGPKKDEVTGGTKKLYEKGLHNLCPTPAIFSLLYIFRKNREG